MALPAQIDHKIYKNYDVELECFVWGLTLLSTYVIIPRVYIRTCPAIANLIPVSPAKSAFINNRK